VDADHVLLEPLHGCAQPLEDLQHHPHVLNVGQVAQRHRIVSQQARRQDRQRRILVSARPDRPFQPAATLDYESFSHRGRLYGN
jgi:hypothetical protein